MDKSTLNFTLNSHVTFWLNEYPDQRFCSSSSLWPPTSVIRVDCSLLSLVGWFIALCIRRQCFATRNWNKRLPMGCAALKCSYVPDDMMDRWLGGARIGCFNVWWRYQYALAQWKAKKEIYCGWMVIFRLPFYRNVSLRRFSHRQIFVDASRP